MEHVSETACEKTWTGRVRLRGGRLPDVPELGRLIRDSGQGAVLRGVEATLSGWLVTWHDGLWLRRDGTGETVRLVPLQRKVQWDPGLGREAAVRGGEREAFSRLRQGWRALSLRVRVTGPLADQPGSSALALEVREFAWQ